MAGDLRREIRADVTALKNHLHQTEAELDAWKIKFYVLKDEYLALKYKEK